MKNTGELARVSCLPSLEKPLLKTPDFEILEGTSPVALDETYRKAVAQTMLFILSQSEDKSLFKAPIHVEQHRGGRRGNCSNFAPGGRRIQLVSGCSKSGLSPHEYAAQHFVHELGHVIGQKRNLYAAYRKEVPKPCHISSYGLNNDNKNPRNEEFAEVFRGVVYDFEQVKAAGGSCVAAAEFFKKLLKLKPNPCAVR